jgi:hypothetical protein
MATYRLLTTVSVALFSTAGAAQDCLSWQEVPMGGLISPRSDAAMCYDAGRNVSVLFGGQGDRTNGDTWEWNGSAWTLRFPSGARAVSGHTLTYDSHRGVSILFGGTPVPNAPASDAWEYDGSLWVQRPEPGPPPRYLHAAAYDDLRAELIVFGGRGRNGVNFGDTWSWNGVQWRQYPAAPGPSPRFRTSMAFDRARGVAVLFGGTRENPPVVTFDTWEWNGAAWVLREDTGPIVDDARLYYDERHQRVRFVGPKRFEYENGFLQTWEWDGSDWTSVSRAGPPVRSEFAMTYEISQDSLVLFGGTYPVRGDCYISRATPLAFTAAPQSRRIDVGETLVLDAAACGQSVEYRWRRDGQPLIDGERITGAATPTLRITDFQPGDAGTYDVLATSPAGSAASPPARVELYQSNTCYADCDTSTGRRVLDVFDFLCFQNRFVAGDPYACDCDCCPGVNPCDIFDFLCFQNRFFSGCP